MEVTGRCRTIYLCRVINPKELRVISFVSRMIK